ncbi:MAG: DUF6922 domain-containing protein [Chloroflexota bacterium]
MAERPADQSQAGSTLPPSLRHLFWDYTFAHLTWTEHHDLITSRVLARGGWADLETLFSLLSPTDLRAYFLRTQGKGLSARILRYFEAALDLPHDTVTGWLGDPQGCVWRER